MRLETYLTNNKIKHIDFCKALCIRSSKLSKVLSGDLRMDLKLAKKIETATFGKVSFEDWLEPEPESETL